MAKKEKWFVTRVTVETHVMAKFNHHVPLPAGR
jgi:hypothetical protein